MVQAKQTMSERAKVGQPGVKVLKIYTQELGLICVWET